MMAPDVPTPAHLTSGEVAGYLDGRLTTAEREQLDGHLADCPTCRAELVEVRRILQSVPRRRSWLMLGTAALAASVALLLLAPRWLERAEAPARFREPATQEALAPRLIMPRGPVKTVNSFVWASVPGADGYRVVVFDREGAVLWEIQTRDTISAKPDSLSFSSGASYFWKVWARTGSSRWTPSALIEFNIVGSATLR
jgi:Putative zinc-finger